MYVGDVFPERLTYDPDRYLSEASARFNVGDRVLAMNGQPVSDVLMAAGLARSFPAGPVTITVEREAELDAVLQRAGGQPGLLLAQARARVLLQRSLLEGPRAMLLRTEVETEVAPYARRELFPFWQGIARGSWA